MTDHYTYRLSWSPEDNEHVATCAEFPGLSWLAEDELSALSGLKDMIRGVVEDMRANGEPIPYALADKKYSGQLSLRRKRQPMAAV
nr:type II toxin-antitoxin system HicB family antitoxin [uncultured Rhodopila sp.]